jgi:mono/diheme cytochrome c family protein
MKKSIAISLLYLALSACQTSSENESLAATGSSAATANDHVQSGVLAFAQAACGGCHAVEAGSLSPNPASPSFADIANRPGLTQGTLATWLRDAHNYPEDMDFDLYDKQVDALSEYILTLRDPAYRAPIS